MTRIMQESEPELNTESVLSFFRRQLGPLDPTDKLETKTGPGGLNHPSTQFLILGGLSDFGSKNLSPNIIMDQIGDLLTAALTDCESTFQSLVDKIIAEIQAGCRTEVESMLEVE